MAQPGMRDGTPSVREGPPKAARASWTNTPFAAQHFKGLAIAVAAGVFMAAVGAFGTDQLPLSVRLGYWIAVIVVGAVGGMAIGALTDRIHWFEDRPWLEGAIIVVALTAPLTLMIWLISSFAFRDTQLARPGPLFFLGPVFLVSCVMTALNYLSGRAPPKTHQRLEGAPPPRFLERLPAKLNGAELFAIEAEDHYLRLHTSKGEDLILMRLSDAVAELEGLEGARVHRSWWVSRQAIVGAKRGDGRALLTLKDGANAPVSRAYARSLREAGWF